MTAWEMVDFGSTARTVTVEIFVPTARRRRGFNSAVMREDCSQTCGETEEWDWLLQGQ